MYRAPRFSALALLVAASASLTASDAFRLPCQSPASMGSANAGASAGGADISAMFFNPASLALYDGNQAVLGFSYINLQVELRDLSGTRAAVFPAPMQPISGPTSVPNGGSSGLVPNLFASWSLSPDLKAGIAINAPFGLGVEYGSDFVGRYHALKSELQVVDIAPTLAYRINPQWSVGAAFIARRGEVDMKNAVDFGAIGAAVGVPGLLPGGQDGIAKANASKWGYGYKLGLMYQPTEALRLGMGFESAISLDLRGDIHYAGVPAPLAGFFQDGRIGGEFRLPSVLSFGFAYAFSGSLSLQGQWSRAEWSSFKQFRMKFLDAAAPAPTESITDFGMQDSTWTSLGLSWKPSEAWTLRCGAAKISPAATTYRSPSLPDNPATWAALGAGYTFSKTLSVDFAYTHVFHQDQDIALRTQPDPSDPNFFRGNLDARMGIKCDAGAVSLHYRF